jgi:hypothetical protein
VLNLQTNPDAAFLLLNNSELYDPVPPAQNDAPPPDEHLYMKTVCANYKGFTRQQVKNAERACRLMGMVATHSEHDFQGMVCHNLLKDCPVTNEDVHNAHAIFGPDLTSIMGKTVCRKPERVVTDCVEIPRDFFMHHNRVTLVTDLMFVNLVLFLVSASHNINLITIKHAPDQKASKLGSLFKCIVHVYAYAGFTVQTILMDNKFNKVKDHVPHFNMNTPAAAEHVGKIERCIQVIKEKPCSIICTLPYPKLPQMMLIHLLHFIVMWLNNFPPAMGISSQWSSREIILCHCLDYKHHCRASMRAYCKVHEDNEDVGHSVHMSWPYRQHSGRIQFFKPCLWPCYQTP